MPKKGGSGSRKSLRVEEKAAQEAEQAAAVVDAQTAAKEAQATIKRLVASLQKRGYVVWFGACASSHGFCDLL